MMNLIPFSKVRRRTTGAWRIVPWALAGAVVLCRLPAEDGAAPATVENALKAYRKGRFAESAGQYSELASGRPDDARLRFNAGTAAYRQKDLTNAARWFESVVAAPDLSLQQRAYYNLGNTRYQLGEAVQDPQERQKLWQQAFTNFSAATKLDASDTNAAGNLAYLRHKLDELQQQMPPPSQQQQQQGSNEDSGKDSEKDQKNDGKQDQKQGDQKQQQDSSGDGSQGRSEGEPGTSKDQKGDNSESNPEASDSSKDAEKKKPETGKEESGKEESKAAKDGGKDGSDPGERATAREGVAGADGQGEAIEAGAEAKDGEMTKAQAVQLLENQKGDEKALLLRAYGGGKEAGRAGRILKPW